MAMNTRTWTLLALLLCGLVTVSRAQESAAELPLADIQQAFAAVEAAGDHAELLSAVSAHAPTIGDRRLPAFIDQLLTADLNDTQRRVLHLERALSVDVGVHGAATATTLSAIRIIALAALQADTPDELAATMARYAPLATQMNADAVLAALAQPAQGWPPALLPLMQQLGSDWAAYGARDAASRMAAAAAAAAPAGAAGSFEDRVGNALLEMGEPIPDGLIHMPQY